MAIRILTEEDKVELEQKIESADISEQVSQAEAAAARAKSSADGAAAQYQITYYAAKRAEEAATRAEEAAASAGNGSGGNVALTADQISALDGMFKICAYTEDASEAYSAFKAAFGITDPVVPDEPDEPVVTMTGISAVYSGGDVPVGTAVAELTGIVVTAMYSDGSSETVTGYTLIGEIAEGSNTVTVSYGGMTATFAVNGVAESGEKIVPVTWTYGYKNLEGTPTATTNSCYSSVIDTTGYNTLTIRVIEGKSVSYCNVYYVVGNAEQTSGTYTKLDGYFSSTHNKEYSIDVTTLSTPYVWFSINDNGKTGNINSEKVEVVLA